MPTTKRISQLADMLIVHMLYGQTTKALFIAQYLRRIHGYHHVPSDRIVASLR